MRKLIFLLLLPIWVFAQSSTGQEQEFDYGIKIETGAIQTVTNPVYPATMGTDGTIGRALAKDLPIDISPQPTNYTISDPKLGSHLKGIDNRLGQIGNTTAGITNRIYFTGVPTTITAGTFYTSSATGKGAVAGVLQTVSNDDNVKNYFGQDVISIAQPSATTAPPGNYSGQLSVMVDNNAAQERFTVEIYKTDNNGTPIASGIDEAPVGNLGVTVVAILDSGVLDLVASSVSNVSVSGNLASTLSLAVGERLRYHVSAQKIGTSGNAFMFSLFYGSDYNSYYDVTVTPTTDGVVNKSAVTGVTATDALNTLNSKLPTSYAKVVYVNNANPNVATIFDLENPPTANDNLLKNDVNNLYIGTDASTWVYNGSIYVTKTVSSQTSNFYLSGTSTDAGASKTGHIYRFGKTSIGGDIVSEGIFNVFTGTSGLGLDLANQPSGAIGFYNNATALATPTIAGKSTNSIGLSLISATNNSNPADSDMEFNARRDTGGDFSTLTSTAFRFKRFGTALIDVLRNGDTGFGTMNPSAKIDINSAINTPAIAIAGFPVMRYSTGDVLDFGAFGATWSSVRLLSSGIETISMSGGSAALKNTPTAPTATVGTNTNQIATMAAVQTATTNNGVITTATNITNATLTDISLPQNGKTLYISNGATNINYTVNTGITASFVKGGTGSITFVQGSGRNMVAANGTLVFNGAQYSTASVVSFGTTDIVYINNF